MRFEQMKPIIKEINPVLIRAKEILDNPTAAQTKLLEDRILADADGREWRPAPAQHDPNATVYLPPDFVDQDHDGLG